MSAFCSGLCNEISRCCYDFYHAPFTKKNLLIGGGVLAALIVIIIIIVCTAGGSSKSKTGSELLKEYPLVDGANSLSYNLKMLFMDKVNEMSNKLSTNLAEYFSSDVKCQSCQTDFVRLKEGLVASQVFSISTDCNAQFKDAVSQTLEQIDLIRRLAANEANKLAIVKQAEDIGKLYKSGKIGAIINLWGGHNIDSRLAVLRMYYDLGVRIMSLVAFSGANPCYSPWINNGTQLTDFGKKVVAEMNRLGMMIDLTGSPLALQIDVLKTTNAPVIFSHSGSTSILSNELNVDDSVLQQFKNNQYLGLIMVPFTPGQLSKNSATMDDVAAHLDLIASFVSTSKVGIGSNFDNMTTTTANLTDVSKFPVLFNHLLNRAPPKSKGVKWSESNLKLLAGQNFINVFKAVEKESAKGGIALDDDIITESAYDKETTCYSDFSVRYNSSIPEPTQPTTTTKATSSTTTEKPHT